jgi:hypothetical protein
MAGLVARPAFAAFGFIIQISRRGRNITRRLGRLNCADGCKWKKAPEIESRALPDDVSSYAAPITSGDTSD